MNFKKIFGVISLSTAIALPFSCFAADMKWDYNEESSTVSVKGYGMINDATPFTKYLNTAKKLTLLKGVTKIEKNVFTSCGEVEEVVLPEGFLSIGDNAFGLSKNLSKINFPDSLEYIGNEAFMDCPLLESVTIGKNVSYIGKNAFAECDSIKDFDVSSENPNYTTVDGVIFTKDKAELIMYPAGRKDENYKIPEGTKKISNKAFSYNRNLVSVDIPQTVAEIDDYAFYFCELLKDVNIENGLKTVGNYAFYGCGMKNILLPYGVESVGDDAFKNCEFLSHVDLPGTVSKVGNDAFYGTDGSLIITGYGDAAKEAAAAAERNFKETVRIIVNNKELRPDTPAFVENGCTMVPMRSIFEALGASVLWDNETQTAFAQRNGIECSFKIGENVLYKNGTAIPLLAGAVLKDGRTLVHVRAIAESFGENVEWNEDTGIVTVGER